MFCMRLMSVSAVLISDRLLLSHARRPRTARWWPSDLEIRRGKSVQWPGNSAARLGDSTWLDSDGSWHLPAKLFFFLRKPACQTWCIQYTTSPIFEAYFHCMLENTPGNDLKANLTCTIIALWYLSYILQSYAKKYPSNNSQVNRLLSLYHNISNLLPFTIISTIRHLIRYMFNVTSCSPYTRIIFLQIFPSRALANFCPSNISTK
jgi:hypothetical protein